MWGEKMLRGIQIIGLLIAFLALTFIIIARRRKRLNTRFFFFWILFWGMFLMLDLYPSIVAYLAPILTLPLNMYILTAGSVLTLFILVFALYSFLSDINQKVTTLVREQAILNSKLARIMAVMDKNEKENSDSNTGS